MNHNEIFNQRILEPCLTMYGKYLDILEGKIENRIELIEQKKKQIESEQIFAVPRIALLCNNKCTLQCKECTALVPRYAKNPHIASSEEIINDGDKLLAAVDECYTFSIASGEIFVYPHLEKVLEHFLKHPKVFLIELMSNGLQIPDEKLVPLLQNKNIVIELSDYGNIEKLVKFIGFCEKYNIKLTVCSTLDWKAAGNFDKRKKDSQQLKEEFFNCSLGYMCKSIFKGKFYHCSRGAFMTEFLKDVTFNENEVVEISDNPEELRIKLKKFYMSEQMPLCDYCDFGSLTPTFVDTAEQTSGKLTYSKFTPILRDDYTDNMNYLNQLQEGKDWLAQQYSNHIEYIKQLEETKEWLTGQYENYKKLYEDSIGKIETSKQYDGLSHKKYKRLRLGRSNKNGTNKRI